MILYKIWYDMAPHWVQIRKKKNLSKKCRTIPEVMATQKCEYNWDGKPICDIQPKYINILLLVIIVNIFFEEIYNDGCVGRDYISMPMTWYHQW